MATFLFYDILRQIIGAQRRQPVFSIFQPELRMQNPASSFIILKNIV
jgi:hypothetical protein